MEPLHTNPKKSSWIHSPIIGVLLTLTVNLLFAAILIVIGRYVNLHSQYFMIAIAVIVLVVLILNVMFLFGYGKRKRFFRYVTIFLSLVLLVVGGVGGYYLFKTNNIANQIVNKSGESANDFSLISFDPAMTLETLDGKNVGYVTTTPAFEQAIQENVGKQSRTVSYVPYQSYDALLAGRMRRDIDYAVVPQNYGFLRKADDNKGIDPMENAKSLFNFTIKQKETVNSKDVLKEPFTMLMIGVNEELADSIILTSFNPETLKITMTSIPRDSYVQIACQNNYPDKVTHARAFGRQCLLDSIESFMDIKIDFYFETDFYALVKMVDALGGLEIESPISFAGSLPKENEPGEFDEILVPEGRSLMNGKQVITFARERYSFAGGDYVRQMNQQYVIKELANKILSTRNVNTLVNVLDAAKDNITMNLSINDITSLMGYALQNVEKSPVGAFDTFRIVSTQLQGEGEIVDDGYTGKYVSHPYMRDMEISRSIIKDNLKHDADLGNHQSFAFTQSHPYRSHFFDLPYSEQLYYPGDYVEEHKANSASESNDGTTIIPELTSMTRREAESWAKQNGVRIAFNTIDETMGAYQDYYDDGQIIHQSLEAGEYYEKQTYIELSIIKKGTTPQVEDDKSEPETEKPKETLMDDIRGWALVDVYKYADAVGLSVTAAGKDDPQEHDIVINQSIQPGTPIGEHKSLIVNVKGPENDSSEE